MMLTQESLQQLWFMIKGKQWDLHKLSLVIFFFKWCDKQKNIRCNHNKVVTIIVTYVFICIFVYNSIYNEESIRKYIYVISYLLDCPINQGCFGLTWAGFQDFNKLHQDFHALLAPSVSLWLAWLCLLPRRLLSRNSTLRRHRRFGQSACWNKECLRRMWQSRIGM